MSEDWRDVPGFPGYQASSDGRIRSLRCGGRYGFNLPRAIPHEMVGIVSHDGYRRVGVRNDEGKRRMMYVHQLVLFAFVGPRPPGCEGSHKSGDQLDNTPGNLEWETKPENNSRKADHGTQPRKFGEANPSAKLTDLQRAEIARRYGAGDVSQRALGKEYGIAQSSVGDIVRAATAEAQPQ